MSVVAKSFTAIGNGLEVLANPGQTVGYAVTGTFVGTVILEQEIQGAWVAAVTAMTVVSRGSFVAEGSGNAKRCRYRFRCSAFTSGTIVTTIDVATPIASAVPVTPILRQATVEIADAAIKTLGATTSVTIVPAPGLNRILIPVSGVMRRVMLAAYTNVNAAATLFLSDSLAGTVVHSNAVDGDFLIAFTDAIATFQPAALYQTTRAALANAGIVLQAGNAAAGAFTGGNAANRLVVTVSYLLLNVETGRYE